MAELFQVKMSVHELPSIELVNAPEELRDMVRGCLMENRMGHPAYETSRNAGAFLQCDDRTRFDNYMLVEFWRNDYQPFVDYLKEQAAKLTTTEDK